MKFKNSKLKLYFKNGNSLITLKKDYVITYNLIENLYGEIREIYLKLNENKNDIMSKLFAESVKIYLSDTSFDKIKKELRITKSTNAIDFGFSSSMRLFTLGNQNLKKEDEAIKKYSKKHKLGYSYEKEV